MYRYVRVYVRSFAQKIDWAAILQASYRHGGKQEFINKITVQSRHDRKTSKVKYSHKMKSKR